MSRDYVTCHVLDTVKGLPAAEIPCTLSSLRNGTETVLANGRTDKDGRISNWDQPIVAMEPGSYKIKFETGLYLSKSNGGTAFFPFVDVVFAVSDPPAEHYHIPLLLSNYSYSTYRGS